MQVINTLLPLLLILGFGAVLARYGFLGLNFMRDLNRLIYYVGLPALIVQSLAAAEFQGERALGIFGALALATLTTVGLATAAAWLLGLPGTSYGTFVQAAFRGNLAYIGVPILVYIFSESGQVARSDLLAVALLALAPTMILYNILSVTALLTSQHRFGWAGLSELLVQILTNPLILASLLGCLLSILPWSLPVALDRSLQSLGEMSVPIALICIGGSLTAVNLQGSWGPAALAAGLKVGAVPLLAYVLGRSWSLDPLAFRILMVFAACPTAVASYIMATQMSGDEALASSAIVLSTLFSIVPLVLIIGFLGGG